jgi:hypothetical protein
VWLYQHSNNNYQDLYINQIYKVSYGNIIIFKKERQCELIKMLETNKVIINFIGMNREKWKYARGTHVE